MATDHVIARIGADINDLKTELAKGNAEFRKFGSKIESAVPKDPFVDLKRSAAGLLTIGALSAPFVKAGQAAATFEAGLRNLNTITRQSEASLKEYGDGLRTLSLELGTTTGAAENARAAYDLASAGFVDAADNAAILETTLKAAAAGSVEADISAKLLAGTLNAYGASAQESERYANVFFKTVEKGVTTFSEMATSLGSVTAIAAQAGVSIEELNGALATATARNLNTSKATDGLRGAITNLLAPSESAKKEMERLGIVVNENTLKQDGLLKTLVRIREANGGSAESFKRLLGDVQAVTIALALTSDGGALFTQNVNEMTNAAGSLDAALQEKAKSFEHSMAQFKVAVEAASVAVGTVFLPAAKAGVDMITNLTTAFATAPEPVRKLIVAVGTLGAAYLAASKGMVLLTTATQRDTIVRALNTTVTIGGMQALIAKTAATVTNTVATTANTVARVASTAATVAASVATGNLTLAKTALTGALTAANGAILATAASMGVLVAAGASVIYLAHKTAEAWRDTAKSMDEYVNASAAVSASIDDALDSLDMSAQKLRENGKSAKELTGEMLALKQAQENIRESIGDGEATEKQAQKLEELAAAYTKLRLKRNELLEIEKAEAAQKKADEPKPEMPKPVEIPTVKAPKIETPKIETPKVETPKIEIPDAKIPVLKVEDLKLPEPEKLPDIFPESPAEDQFAGVEKVREAESKRHSERMEHIETEKQAEEEARPTSGGVLSLEEFVKQSDMGFGESSNGKPGEAGPVEQAASGMQALVQAPDERRTAAGEGAPGGGSLDTTNSILREILGAIRGNGGGSQTRPANADPLPTKATPFQYTTNRS